MDITDIGVSRSDAFRDRKLVCGYHVIGATDQYISINLISLIGACWGKGVITDFYRFGIVDKLHAAAVGQLNVAFVVRSTHKLI